MAIKPIVVGIDGSEPSLRAVDWATREAVLRDVPLRIVSVCAIEPRINWVADLVAVGRHAARRPASTGSTLSPATLAVLAHAHGPIAIVPDQS